jgi:hypothetical protein
MGRRYEEYTDLIFSWMRFNRYQEKVCQNLHLS